MGSGFESQGAHFSFKRAGQVTDRLVFVVCEFWFRSLSERIVAALLLRLTFASATGDVLNVEVRAEMVGFLSTLGSFDSELTFLRQWGSVSHIQG